MIYRLSNGFVNTVCQHVFLLGWSLYSQNHKCAHILPLASNNSTEAYTNVMRIYGRSTHETAFYGFRQYQYTQRTRSLPPLGSGSQID